MGWVSNRLADSERIVSGDIVDLQFKALEAGTPIDLSAFTEIAVKVFALGADGKPSGAALISDNLAGDVDLVSGGTGGLFKDALAAADTAGLSGLYWLQVKLTDAASKVRTCRPIIVPIDADLITA